MNEMVFDENKNYFYLYEQAVEENKKLRERINYPKIELDEFNFEQLMQQTIDENKIK